MYKYIYRLIFTLSDINTVSYMHIVNSQFIACFTWIPVPRLYQALRVTFPLTSRITAFSLQCGNDGSPSHLLVFWLHNPSTQKTETRIGARTVFNRWQFVLLGLTFIIFMPVITPSYSQWMILQYLLIDWVTCCFDIFHSVVLIFLLWLSDAIYNSDKYIGQYVSVSRTVVDSYQNPSCENNTHRTVFIHCTTCPPSLME